MLSFASPVLAIILDKDPSEYGRNIHCPSNHYQNKTFINPLLHTAGNGAALSFYIRLADLYSCLQCRFNYKCSHFSWQ